MKNGIKGRNVAEVAKNYIEMLVTSNKIRKFAVALIFTGHCRTLRIK